MKLEDIILLKAIKTKVMSKIIEKHGKGVGELSKMYLSIWDVRIILYEILNDKAKFIFEEKF